MSRLREVALASARASVMIFFIRASGANGLPLIDADGGERSHQLGVERGGRLVLHDLVEHLVIGPVVGRNGAERLAADFVEHGRRRFAEPAELGLAVKELGDGCADATGFIRIESS